jgi:hypothetical protein
MPFTVSHLLFPSTTHNYPSIEIESKSLSAVPVVLWEHNFFITNTNTNTNANNTRSMLLLLLSHLCLCLLLSPLEPVTLIRYAIILPSMAWTEAAEMCFACYVMEWRWIGGEARVSSMFRYEGGNVATRDSEKEACTLKAYIH